jgi:hypothetical protein
MKHPMNKLFYLLSVSLSLSLSISLVCGEAVWCKGSEREYNSYSVVHVESIGIRD